MFRALFLALFSGRARRRARSASSGAAGLWFWFVAAGLMVGYALMFTK